MCARRFEIAFMGVLVTMCMLFCRAASAQDEQPIIFYLHGLIIENEGPTPTHSEFGLYDYPAVVEALGSRGARVISEVREGNTNIYDYAGRTIGRIERLIAQGISPDRIVIVGFSKGGAIMIHVSSFLRRPEIRYVPLAACSSWLAAYPHLRLTGHVFSLYEKSDELAGSCKAMFNKNKELKAFEERMIDTGNRHGAFYLPDSQWVDPVLDWVYDDS
jgi:hypothetical protein